MTKVYFEHGQYVRQEGDGRVSYKGNILSLYYNDFMLFGDLEFRSNISVNKASLDAKDATITNSSVRLFSSKAENINDAFKIRLWNNSSISNSSTNELEIRRGNNTIEGTVSAKVVKFDEDTTLSIAKNGALKVSDKNALDFSKISGEGRIYDEKTHAYYDTNNKILEYNIDLSTLKAGDGDEAFSFDGTKLVLNEGYEFKLSGDKPAFITNNATILKADINGAKLINISGSGIIKELHLSNNARFSINSDFGKAVIEKGSVLTLFKQVDFKNISGSGLVNINGTIYNTDGHALNNANDSLVADIREYDFAIAKEIKEQKEAYINVDESQNTDVDLLNIEAINNDNLL